MSAERVPRDPRRRACHTPEVGFLAELAEHRKPRCVRPVTVRKTYGNRAAMSEIGRRLVEVGWRANDDQSAVVALAADFADSSEWAAAGYSTPGRWIAEMLEIAPRTANGWIRVGRCLRDLPQTASALNERAISFTKAKELTRSATPENERDLLEIAATTRASDLSREIALSLIHI